MKRIAYLVTDSGVDGMQPTHSLYASFDETKRDAMLEKDKAKAWRSKDEEIIDEASVYMRALSKLDGVERLVLGLPAWPDNTWKDNLGRD